ncbi:hypothetical protein B0O99DRAFT_183609 [Bisporella sp. PMI_857]|nr:hypothetical protein B0O99DRAFT_183609 [Bisporella sp. PMI_857]
MPDICNRTRVSLFDGKLLTNIDICSTPNMPATNIQSMFSYPWEVCGVAGPDPELKRDLLGMSDSKNLVSCFQFSHRSPQNSDPALRHQPARQSFCSHQMGNYSRVACTHEVRTPAVGQDHDIHQCSICLSHIQHCHFKHRALCRRIASG